MENVIKEIRERKGLTQAEFGNICGVGFQTIFDLEHFNRETINEGVLDTISELGYSSYEIEKEYKYQSKQHKNKLLKQAKGANNEN